MEGRGFGSKSRSLPLHLPRPPMGSLAPPGGDGDPLRVPSGKCPRGVSSRPLRPPGVHRRCPDAPFVLPVPETKQKPLSLGHRPSPGGGSPCLPSRGAPGKGLGEPSGLTACLCNHPSVTEGPLCTQAPPDPGPLAFPMLHAVEFNAKSDRKAPVLTCVLGHRVTHLLSMCSRGMQAGALKGIFYVFLRTFTMSLASVSAPETCPRVVCNVW